MKKNQGLLSIIHHQNMKNRTVPKFNQSIYNKNSVSSDLCKEKVKYLKLLDIKCIKITMNSNQGIVLFKNMLNNIQYIENNLMHRINLLFYSKSNDYNILFFLHLKLNPISLLFMLYCIVMNLDLQGIKKFFL